jgi:imidazoleglycerol phosphate synthase glutamine amidotransferase subunit HisH
MFPGGDVDIIHSNNFNDRMKKTLTYVKARNDKGYHYFAIGICMGFEILLEQTAGTSSILDSGYKHFTTGGVEIVNHEALQKSDFFGKGRARAVLKKWLRRSDGLLYAHNDGVSVQHFNTFLSDKHHLIATGSSGDGKKFVAMTASRGYPIFTTQFHPEKNQYEKRRANTTSSTESHRSLRYFKVG